MTDKPVRAMIVLDVALPTPEAVSEIIAAIDPPNVPHFDGTLRVAVAPASAEVAAFLDDKLVTLSPDAHLAAVLQTFEGIHHFHGSQCLCGYSSDRARSRTAHITRGLIESLHGPSALEGMSPA